MEFLKKLLEARQGAANQLKDKIKASTNADEVRALGEQLDAVNGEIAEIRAEMQKLEAPNVQNTPANGEARANLNPLATFSNTNTTPANGEARANNGEGETMEYRTAFMNFVLRGTPIPKELRADANTLTTDVSSVIPTVLINRIIEKMDNVGMILPLVTRTNYAAGVEIPTSSAKPTATWVAEGASSDRQKKTTGKITFSYYKLRCEISMSMEVGTMALSAFEAKFVENVSKAMVKAIEQAIINGTGTSQPKGILAETAPSGQAITIAKADTLDYQTLVAAEAAIPEEYEGGAKWCMSKKTFMKFVGMVDANGQPIARVNYGIGGRPERTLLGRDVVLASTYMPNYEDAPTSATVFAFIFDFSDYMLNTIYDMGISRKQDWDTEDYLTKAVMSVDGKVIDTGSLVTLTKSNA